MVRLPFRYSLRNLFRRRTRTLLTVLGLGLALGVITFTLAFSRSLGAVVRTTGDLDNLIVISKRAETHILSSITGKDCEQIRAKFYGDAATFTRPGKTDPEALISLEVYIGLNVRTSGRSRPRDARQRGVIHGVDPKMALEINSTVSLVEGRLPRAGARELLCGAIAAARLGIPDTELSIGSTVQLLNAEWKVVGRFTAPGTLMESELWTHVDDLRLYLRRTDYSFVRIKLKNPDTMAALIERITTDEQFEVKAFSEQRFFADYAAGFDFFRQFAHFLTLLTALGGVLAGMNTMYTAIMGRVREIGTLQILGFSKKAILAGMMSEACMLALAGALVGTILGGFAHGIPVRIPMAAVEIQVDAVVLLWTLAAAVCICVAGTCVPAYRVLKLRMVDAVRYD